MPAILSQDPNGRWTIKNIRHMTNIPGLKIPATFIYRGPGAETMGDDRRVEIPNGIEFTSKTIPTNWYTEPGVEINIQEMQNGVFPRVDDVERVYGDVLYGGYTYKVTKEIFEVNAYTGDTPDVCTQESAPCSCDDECTRDVPPCSCDDECSSECTPYSPCDTAPCSCDDECTRDVPPCSCDDECSSECVPYSPCSCDDECSSECVPYSPCDTAPCDDECSSECVPYSPCDTAPCDTAPCSCDDEIAPCPEDCYVEENGNIYLEKEGIADESHELTIPVGAAEQDITYKVWTNTDCQVSGMTAATQNGTAYAEFYDNEGNMLGIFSPFGPFCGEKVDFSVHIPKNLANVDQEYKIVFRALNSNKSAKAIFQQERKRVIGREDYEIENFWIRDASSPEQYVPADEAYYTPFVEVMCTERYNNGDSDPTIVTDYWNNGAIDENKLTITTNDTTNCLILDDVGHGGGYQASPDYPFKIYLRANSGTTGVGSERHINLTLTYTNGGMETVSKTIEIIQAYQMVIPEENDVQFYYQGEYKDEIEADTRVNESFTVSVAKGTAGSTKLYVVSPDGANLASYVSNVTLAGVTLTEDDLDHHDGIIMQESSVIFTFNRDVPYEFSIGILVEEPGKEDKQLLVEFPSLN